MSAPVEGWAYVVAPTRLRHYFVDGRSLCNEVERRPDAGQWAFGQYPSPYTHDEGAEAPSCARCKKALIKRQDLLRAEARLAEMKARERAQWEPFDGC